MERSLLVLILAVWFALPAIGQTNESDEKASLGGGNSVSFKSPDSSIYLQFRFRMQNQAGLFSEDGQSLQLASIEGRIRRLRIRFDGYLWNPKLTYIVQLSFSRNDLDVREEEAPNIVRDAIVYYRPVSWFQVGLGQAKLPGNRQRIVSSGNLQFAERSIANARFNIDRDFGLFFTFRFWEKRLLKLRGAVSTGEGRNAFNNSPGLCYTGRLEWEPFGQFSNEGDYSEGDLEFTQKPKLAVAVAHYLNEHTSHTAGQLGPNLYTRTTLSGSFADFVFKYRGWSLTGEYMNRRAANPLQTAAGEPQLVIYAGHGWMGQLGRMLSRKTEVSLRYAGIVPNASIAGQESKQEEILAGFTYYLKGHRIKSQLNAGYRVSGGNFNTRQEGNFWLLLFQLELGI